ncbi:hypothetical protein COOONC_13125 [Cooperia oncophora]
MRWESSTLDMLWSFLNICFPIAMIFGQFLAAFLCKRIGRRYTALLASAMYIPATLLSAASKICFPAFELLFVGRILWWVSIRIALRECKIMAQLFRSLACGINSVNATVWIVECAPPAIRGRMAATQEFLYGYRLNTAGKDESVSYSGSLITQALGVPFADDTLWPLIFLPNVVFVIVSMIMFGFLYDSPQYIMQKTGDPEQARKALAAYHGVDVSDSSIDTEIRICEEALTKEKSKKEVRRFC